MSKELPYFKFYPGEWMTGDITLCSMDAQGLFTNICSYYWKKECSMSLANAKQRFSKHEASLNELLQSEIIKVNEDDCLVIDFLDEQMGEFLDVSEKRAKAGKKGGIAKAKQMLKFAKAKPSNKEGDQIKSDKDNKYSFDSFWNSYHTITSKQKTDKEAAIKYWNKLSETEKGNAIEMITPYFNSLSDVKYCKKARTYLSDKNFNDEFVNKTSTAAGRNNVTPEHRPGDLVPNPDWKDDW